MIHILSKTFSMLGSSYILCRVSGISQEFHSAQVPAQKVKMMLFSTQSPAFKNAEEPLVSKISILPLNPTQTGHQTWRQQGWVGGLSQAWTTLLHQGNDLLSSFQAQAV